MTCLSPRRVQLTRRGWPLSCITRVPVGYTRSDPTRSDPTRSTGRVRPVQRVGSDLNTRGHLDPAGNYATGTRVPAGTRVPVSFEDPWFNTYSSTIPASISRKLIQTSNRVVPEARGHIIDLYFLVRLLLFPVVVMVVADYVVAVVAVFKDTIAVAKTSDS